MQQIPIEEVLVEFRKKYGDSEKEQALEQEQVQECVISENSEKSDTPRPVLRVPHSRKTISFRRIIAVQCATAAIVLGLIIAVRFFNADLYEYIKGVLEVVFA